MDNQNLLKLHAVTAVSFVVTLLICFVMIVSCLWYIGHVDLVMGWAFIAAGTLMSVVSLILGKMVDIIHEEMDERRLEGGLFNRLFRAVIELL